MCVGIAGVQPEPHCDICGSLSLMSSWALPSIKMYETSCFTAVLVATVKMNVIQTRSFILGGVYFL